MTKIDICVATFKRPEMLADLLNSLARQQVNSDIYFRAIVVDNDPEESARLPVAKLDAKLDFPVVYAAEPERGITYARNRALSLVDADYFAFLDDDEFADAQWLQHMYDAAVLYKADAVFGPVIGILPEGAPVWATTQPIYNRPRKETGTACKLGGTGNVLVKVSSLGEPMMVFDNAYALTGGGDTEFFYRLHRSGGALVWCDEATVSEHVPSERLTTKWLYRRAYRGGQCYVRVFGAEDGAAIRALRITKKSVYLVAGCLLLPFAFCTSPSFYIRLRSRINSALGELSVLLGKSRFYEEYGHSSYRESKESGKSQKIDTRKNS